MSPSGRRIALVLVWIAVTEVALTIVILLVIWLESGAAP
jgi:hypothetical protein